MPSVLLTPNYLHSLKLNRYTKRYNITLEKHLFFLVYPDDPSGNRNSLAFQDCPNPLDQKLSEVSYALHKKTNPEVINEIKPPMSIS